jgi:hypothetical protein
MPKKSSLFKIRMPSIRIGRKGPRLTNVGASIGGKDSRVNISRQGVSTTVGVPGVHYNTRRGCLISPAVLFRGLFKKRR